MVTADSSPALIAVATFIMSVKSNPPTPHTPTLTSTSVTLGLYA